MRVRDEDPILWGRPLRPASGREIEVFEEDGTTPATVYIVDVGATEANAPLSTNDNGYVIDADGERVYYDEGSYVRSVVGSDHVQSFQAVSGLSPGGRLRGAVAITSSFSTALTTAQDVPGSSFDITEDGRPTIARAGFVYATSTVANRGGILYIARDVGKTGSFTIEQWILTGQIPTIGNFSSSGERSVELAAGTPGTLTTYKLQFQSLISGTVTFQAGAGFPATLIVIAG